MKKMRFPKKDMMSKDDLRIINQKKEYENEWLRAKNKQLIGIIVQIAKIKDDPEKLKFFASQLDALIEEEKRKENKS